VDLNRLAETFDQTPRAFSRVTPFRPFTVELMSGARFQVDHPEPLVFRKGVAVCIDSDGTPPIFDHHGVTLLSGQKDEATRS